MPQQRTRRFIRQPERFSNRQITPRSFTIQHIIARFRFIAASMIIRLVAGDHRTTADHLQMLYHKGMVNRFQLIRNGEFIYYLDNPEAAQRLIDDAGISARDVDLEEVRNNREKHYADTEDPGKRMFIRHELMVSRFHFMLEQACAHTENVNLVTWIQGSKLHHTVAVPKLARDRGIVYETDKGEYLPHRPDGFFTLSVRQIDGCVGELSFFYEADRKTMALKRMREKLRAHFQFVVKQRLHREKYGVERIRAVLVETIDRNWGMELRRLAADPIVSPVKPSPLFMFTTSELFTQITATDEHLINRGPAFLIRPEVIFDSIWATAVNNRLGSILE